MENNHLPFRLLILDSNGNAIFTDQSLQKEFQKGDSIFRYIQADKLPIYPAQFHTPHGLLLLYPTSTSLFNGYCGFFFAKNLHDEALNCLIKSNKELEVIFNFSHDGIVVADSQGNLIRINKNYEKITGIPVKEVMGRNARDIVKQGTISESGTLAVLKTGKEVTLSQKFRSGFESIITSVPIYDENQNISLVITNLRDTTEINSLKQQLAETEQQRDHYSQIVEALSEEQIITSNLLIFRGQKMQALVKTALKFAKLDSPLLITGESGVGKEVIADILYKNSPRKEAPFLKLNCGAIPETLLESELFGYEGGAFTGAKKEGQVGLFRNSS